MSESIRRPRTDSEKVAYAVKAATGLLGIVLVGTNLGTANDRDRTYDIARATFAPTPQETTIRQALGSVLGTTVLVRCDSVEPAGNPHNVRYGYTHSSTYLPEAMRLRPDICNDFMQLADRDKPFMPPELGRVARAVWVTAHEGGHTQIGANESDASCIGTYITDDLARTMGASEAVAQQMGEAGFAIWRSGDIAPGQYLPAAYFPTERCDNGRVVD